MPVLFDQVAPLLLELPDALLCHDIHALLRLGLRQLVHLIQASLEALLDGGERLHELFALKCDQSKR